MKLSAEQRQQFNRDGYLFFPSLFTPAEIKVLTDEVPALYAQRRPENVREKTGDVVRTNFAAHLYSYPFAKLARHPRMVEPVKQVYGEDVYMHQFKINGKAAFDGDVWQWHQDYGTWRADDQMPEARAMNVAIFLDEVNEFNGPLMFIPGSHQLRVLDRGDRIAGRLDHDVDLGICNELAPVLRDRRALDQLRLPAYAREIRPCIVGREIGDADQANARRLRHLREIHGRELTRADQTEAQRVVFSLLQLCVEVHGLAE